MSYFTNGANPSVKRHLIKIHTMPFQSSSRRKPRRWPLAFRFIKGAIHANIALPVTLHTLFAVFVVVLNHYVDRDIQLPSSIIPSLSIVVGLMLVFRNQTSYDRFWQGRNHVTTVATSVRNMTRQFLAASHNSDHSKPPPTRPAELADTEQAVKNLIAMIYTLKYHLRADWGAYSDKSAHGHPMIYEHDNPPEYVELMPPGFVGLENRGLGKTLQLALLLEGYIKRGHARGWWHGPMSSNLTLQLNNLTAAYGSMETIRLTPIPVAHLIHQKQVLALFGAILPFATVADLDWWSIPIVAIVVFTLYGIDGIASQLEDPFGFDRIDIPLDAIIEDVRAETLVILDEWKAVVETEDEQSGMEWGKEWFKAGPRRTPPSGNPFQDYD